MVCIAVNLKKILLKKIDITLDIIKLRKRLRCGMKWWIEFPKGKNNYKNGTV